MIQELVYHAARGLNQFPTKNGVSDTLSPLTIMTGRANPDYNDLKLEFGSYVQDFEENDPSKTKKQEETPRVTTLSCHLQPESAYRAISGPKSL